MAREQLLIHSNCWGSAPDPGVYRSGFPGSDTVDAMFAPLMGGKTTINDGLSYAECGYLTVTVRLKLRFWCG